MLSIIIPTYKEERYIGRTLQGLKTGLTLPHEVIVTDDNSPDATAEIARRYADIVLTVAEKHSTIAANRNYGEKSAHGDFLVFMDADSTIREPDAFFTRALVRFQADPRLVALTGALKVWPETETVGDRLVYPLFNLLHRLKNNVFHAGEASGKFQMIRRKAFLAVGGFNKDLVTREDADMFQRLLKAGRTRYDPRLVVYHSGRRAHMIGWPKLLWTWAYQTSRVAVSGVSNLKEWKAFR